MTVGVDDPTLEGQILDVVPEHIRPVDGDDGAGGVLEANGQEKIDCVHPGCVIDVYGFGDPFLREPGVLIGQQEEGDQNDGEGGDSADPSLPHGPVVRVRQ